MKKIVSNRHKKLLVSVPVKDDGIGDWLHGLAIIKLIAEKFPQIIPEMQIIIFVQDSDRDRVERDIDSLKKLIQISTT